ncbi:MAG: fatty acid desaturase [Deltaproteobacteria bacterium]|nr:fatty acid desaturase [Deltaproteobacteria bacterium]
MPGPSLTLTDPTAAPTYAPSAFQRAILGLLYDPRDAVFVRLTLKSAAIMLPLIALLYARFSWWLAALVFAVQLPLLAPPVILMLHNTMHRPFFKKARWLNRAHPYLMSGLFGIPTGYMEHHVGMHHVENNLRNDLSSTMQYQRDNVLHWLQYVGRFFFTSHLGLSTYLVSKSRGQLALRAMVSDGVHLAAMAALWFVNPRATLCAFIIPYLVVRIMMMVGNWGQHAFIDPSRPGDSYVNSITCINGVYNHKCFNDGYHIGHHIKQNRHWTEMPQDFLDNVERYRKEGCIVFQKIDFFMVSMLLFARRYDILAKNFVRLPGDSRTDAEVIEFLKSRTVIFAADVPDAVVANV